MGGLPSWLLGDTGLEQREKSGLGLLNIKDFNFREDYKKYLNSFLWLVAAKQVIFNGPIIGVVISYYKLADNEHQQANDLVRFYGDEYAELIQAAMTEHSIAEILLTTLTTCENESPDNTDFFDSTCDKNLRIYLPVVEDLKETRISKKHSFEGGFRRNSARERLLKADCYGN